MECTEEKPGKICQLWAEKLVSTACSKISERVATLESFASITKWIGTTGAGVLILLVGFFFGQNGKMATMANKIDNIEKTLDRLVPDKKGKSLSILPSKKEVSYCDFLEGKYKKKIKKET